MTDTADQCDFIIVVPCLQVSCTEYYIRLDSFRYCPDYRGIFRLFSKCHFVNQTIPCALYLLEMLPESVRQFVDK